MGLTDSANCSDFFPCLKVKGLLHGGWDSWNLNKPLALERRGALCEWGLLSSTCMGLKQSQGAPGS